MKKSYFKYKLDDIGNAIYSSYATMKLNVAWLGDMLDLIDDSSELDPEATLKSMKEALAEIVSDFELTISKLEKLVAEDAIY